MQLKKNLKFLILWKVSSDYKFLKYLGGRKKKKKPFLNMYGRYTA